MRDLKIVIADDHPLFLRGIMDFLNQIGFKNLEIARDGLQALQKIQDHHPDIAILDIEMPYLTGIEVAQKVKEHHLDTKIILISYQRDTMIIDLAGKLNISGYLLKEDSMSEIERCIQALQEGNTYFSKNITKGERSRHLVSPVNELTQTERKVLKMVAEDKTSKTIAAEYGVSARTIEKHRSNIIEKLGLEAKPTSLLIWARENKKFL